MFNLKKKKGIFFFRKKIRLSSVLKRNPQKKSTVSSIRTKTPRKPNSARRKIVKGFLRKTQLNIISYIPGGSHNLKKYSNVLSRGGGARDLPGVYTSLVRGVYDLSGLMYKRRRRSIYGVKK